MNAIMLERISLRKDNGYVPKFVLFILYPFAAFLISLLDIKRRSSYMVFFLFGVLLCWHMSPYNTTSYDDFLGILGRFLANTYSTSDIRQQIISYFTFSEDAPKEIYENVLNYVVKEISGNYHLFFALASVPVLICMLKTSYMITSDRKFTHSMMSLVLLLLLILPRDIITVQNPRFATGFWVATYATISYFYFHTKRWMYFLLIGITPCFHSAFWVYVILFSIYILVPLRISLVTVLYYISIPFSFLKTDIFRDWNVTFLPANVRAWVERGMSDEKFEIYVEGAGKSGLFWVQDGFSLLMSAIYIFMTLKLLEHVKSNKIGNNADYKLFEFYLYFSCLVNLFQGIPILGERFFWFVQVFCVFIWFKMVFPRCNGYLKWLLFSFSFNICRRYLYFMGGALSVCMPPDIFIMPLPYLVYKGFQ